MGIRKMQKTGRIILSALLFVSSVCLAQDTIKQPTHVKDSLIALPPHGLDVSFHSGSNIARGEYGTTPLVGFDPNIPATQVPGNALNWGVHMNLCGNYRFSPRVAWVLKFAVDRNLTSRSSSAASAGQDSYYVFQYLTGFNFLMMPPASRFNMQITTLLGLSSLRSNNSYHYTADNWTSFSEGYQVPGKGSGGAAYAGIGCTYKYSKRMFLSFQAGEMFSDIGFVHATLTTYNTTLGTPSNPYNTTVSVTNKYMSMQVNLLQFEVGLGYTIL